MKTVKHMCMVIFLISSLSSNSQIRVNNFGHVGIGTSEAAPLTSLLNVGGDGSDVYTMSLKPLSGIKGLYISNYTQGHSFGIYVNNFVRSKYVTTGIYVNTSSSSDTTSSQVYGIRSIASGSKRFCIGVYGGVDTLVAQNSQPTFSAGIYGTSRALYDYQRSGNYAGYFNGDVYVSGMTYINALTPVNNSISAIITPLSSIEDKQNFTDKLSQLLPVQIYDDTEPQPIKPTEDEIAVARDNGEKIPEESIPLQTRISFKRYGVDEKSLRKLFPELVYEDKEGSISINYTEMIPLLLQSIKELHAEIEELKRQLEGK